MHDACSSSSASSSCSVTTPPGKRKPGGMQPSCNQHPSDNLSPSRPYFLPLTLVTPRASFSGQGERAGSVPMSPARPDSSSSSTSASAAAATEGVALKAPPLKEDETMQLPGGGGGGGGGDKLTSSAITTTIVTTGVGWDDLESQNSQSELFSGGEDSLDEIGCCYCCCCCLYLCPSLAHAANRHRHWCSKCFCDHVSAFIFLG